MALLDESGLKYLWSQLKTKFAAKNHTHNYAGSASAGGSATSAVKLDTATAGSATQPVYFSGGKPVATTYTLGKSVPSNAVFTDTNTKVTQTAVTSASYTNWRSLVWGASNSTTEGFAPATATDGVFVSDTLSCQPSSGTLKATTFKGTNVNLGGGCTMMYNTNNKCVDFVFS